jgi:hypothetical protein
MSLVLGIQHKRLVGTPFGDGDITLADHRLDHDHPGVLLLVACLIPWRP